MILTDDDLLALLHRTTDAVVGALAATADWGPSGLRAGQYRSDLAADRAAVTALVGAGLGVLSEESGRHHPDRPITVVVDPLDGSTNAAHGIPWYGTSLCAVDADGPRIALVTDLVHRSRYQAVRGAGATVDGQRLATSGQEHLDRSVLAVNGLPARYYGWAQFRALGAAALDLCAVADGRVDGFVDCSDDGLYPWDYLGALLVCREAGASVEDASGRDLVVLDHGPRRRPVAGATRALLTAVLTALAAGP